jgi:hypothetical protein
MILRGFMKPKIFSLFLIPAVFLGACERSIATKLSEVEPSPSAASYLSCFPKELYRKPKDVASFTSNDGNTYWQMYAVAYTHDEKLNTPHQLFFKTNGGCKMLSNPSSKPVSRLKIMSKDAAIALAKAHYKPFFEKCFATQTKDACIKGFYESIKPSDESDGVVVVFPEEAIALRDFGVKVNATKEF